MDIEVDKDSLDKCFAEALFALSTLHSALKVYPITQDLGKANAEQVSSYMTTLRSMQRYWWTAK